MTTTTWIIIAVVAVIVLALVAFAVRSATQKKRAAEADRIREEVHVDDQKLQRRESIAVETEAKARAAQAEAEAKAAEAARLQDRASSHREVVDSTRSNLDERREHADSLDPRVKSSGRADDQVDESDRVVVRDGNDGRHEVQAQDVRQDARHDVQAQDVHGQDVHGRHADGRPTR
jgi:type IV secretory pathway VirB10-like protein